MHKNSHMKTRINARKSQSNCISLQNPLAFSIQLKHNNSQSSSPTSHSQKLKIYNKSNNSRGWTSQTKSRTVSTQLNNNSVRVLSGKSYRANWTQIQNNKNKGEKQDIKWIGVYPQPKNKQQMHSQAFPKRPQRYADQSFANFMLRYAKCLKNNINKKDKLAIDDKLQSNMLYQNAATVKVKPRLFWYQRKKSVVQQRSVGKSSKADVLWLKNIN